MGTWYSQLVNIEKEFTPAVRGILSNSEVEFIKQNLTFPKDEIMLRNLRDFVVFAFSDFIRDANEQKNYNEVFRINDLISGITFLIDKELVNLGCEV